jgi:lipoyl(octanoyl) transferase
MPLARPSTSDRDQADGSRNARCEPDHGERPLLRVIRLPGLRPYRATWDLQRTLLDARIRGEIPDTLLLLEHTPVVTVGRNAREANLIAPERLLEERGIDLVRTDRGGDVTYHGPGQLIAYPIVDLKSLHNDIHRFLREIEEGIIRAVAHWGIEAARVAGKTGVWVGEEKIASIGLKASHWVTMHGLALNVATDLRGFELIVPCGIAGCRMTSMERLTGSQIEVPSVGDVVVRELGAIWDRACVDEGLPQWAN